MNQKNFIENAFIIDNNISKNNETKKDFTKSIKNDHLNKDKNNLIINLIKTKKNSKKITGKRKVIFLL